MDLMMENTRQTKSVSNDSAYDSSAMDTDTEEGQTHSNITLILTYNEELMHKTILVGDSGVGKTSLLVQFDQGKFITGSFSATVGIGFTLPNQTEGNYNGQSGLLRGLLVPLYPTSKTCTSPE
ncbi:uncharacterized protein LOC127452266 [Myxocyprinus asiaticus]|uniref:uncharacterized protein LOC127452266 n=1 Tax=Myxocyprinus asiaticus TaxID=70543 RepID=UPI002221448C|nr:uncharacterized protein LOC127452266 [Myxocyprinus asiaticus]